MFASGNKLYYTTYFGSLKIYEAAELESNIIHFGFNDISKMVLLCTDDRSIHLFKYDDYIDIFSGILTRTRFEEVYRSKSPSLYEPLYYNVGRQVTILYPDMIHRIGLSEEKIIKISELHQISPKGFIDRVIPSDDLSLDVVIENNCYKIYFDINLIHKLDESDLGTDDGNKNISLEGSYLTSNGTLYINGDLSMEDVVNVTPFCEFILTRDQFLFVRDHNKMDDKVIIDFNHQGVILPTTHPSDIRRNKVVKIKSSRK